MLDTIPSIGPVTIYATLAELDDYRRFRKRSAVSAYVGLVPVSKRSGDASCYGRISQRGSTVLRSVLVEVARDMAAKVPRYQRLFETIRYRKGYKKAVVAVAPQRIRDA